MNTCSLECVYIITNGNNKLLYVIQHICLCLEEPNSENLFIYT